MRRIVALMMVVVLLCATALPVRALPEFNDQNYLVDDYIQAVYDRYEADYNSGSFCSWEQYYQNDARFGYVMSDYAFENHTGLAKKYIDIADALIDDTYLLDPERTNVDVKVQYYEVALLSLIKTVEQNLLSYEVQSSADETMTTFDYLIEGAGAAAFLAGLPEGDAVVKGVQTLISSVSGSINILDECLNTLESDDDWAVLEKMWITYDNVERILAAIEYYPHAEGDETMGYLKQAARNLRTGMKYSLLANLNNFNEFLGKTTEEIGSFVFSDVLETVTEQEMKVVAPAMQAMDWECLRLVSKAAKFMGNITGMINAGVFLGDCLVGASDVLLRYHEIRAMAAVRRAVLYQAQLLHLNINGVEDTALIQEFGEYLHDLLYITARGEYCVYSLQTEDANLLTLLVDGEEREWYGMAMTQLSQEYNNVSSLYPNIGFYLRDESSLSDVNSFTAVMTDIDAGDINAINALLVGVGYPPNQEEAVVASWSDERIFNILCSKRMWDWNSAYMAELAIGDEFSIDLSLVEKLSQDMFGREFPVNVKSDLGSVSGNKLNVELIIGESTELVVQNGTKQGNRVTVVGSVYHHYVPFSEFHGYFKAELVENPSSIYGYTLTSIYRTEGNQNFDNITASASSELKETNLTHYANRVIDGDLDTAWVEGVRGVGINEWIMLETTDNSKMTVSAIEFSLGYQKSDQLLKSNGWPNKVLIECENNYKQEAEFYTFDYSSVVVLDQSQTTKWIKITILEATPGAKYDDTCISEICLYGIDPDIELTPDDGESLTTEHDSVSETGGFAKGVNISEEEAYQIACDYWNYSEGDVSSETGFDLYLVYDGLLEESNGNHYYAFRLRWWVAENNMLSTVDYLYINAETGECSYSI